MIEQEIVEAQNALARGDWEDARDLYQSLADRVPSSPEILEGLGWATYWLQEGESSLDARESAYSLYVKRGDSRRACRVAIGLAVDSVDYRGVAVGNGWLARASSLIEQDEDAVQERGWLLLWQGHFSRAFEHDSSTAIQKSREAAAIARDLGLHDLEVERLFEQVGELDILINDIWGGDDLVEWGKNLWETKLEGGLTLIDRAIKTHIITSYYGLPRLRQGGLVVEITDGDGYYYRGHFFYDLVKTTVIRMAFSLSQELKGRGITALAVTPGFLRSEWMLDHFGVTEENWRDAATKTKSFIASETPLFVGRGIAALAADPNVAAKNGRVFASWDLGEEYGVDDADGSRPHFYQWLQENEPEMAAGWKKLDDLFYEYWGSVPYDTP